MQCNVIYTNVYITYNIMSYNTYVYIHTHLSLYIYIHIYNADAYTANSQAR